MGARKMIVASRFVRDEAIKLLKIEEKFDGTVELTIDSYYDDALIVTINKPDCFEMISEKEDSESLFNFGDEENESTGQ
tara:strand:+ start:55 stop:291 length:237 start_codon:yes stop_codon:yes gene_type:complete